MEKLTFKPLSDATNKIVANVERAMRARRRQKYDTPATEQTKRVTQRMLGEKDED